jgi:uncharacterized Tic20 family protein
MHMNAGGNAAVNNAWDQPRSTTPPGTRYRDEAASPDERQYGIAIHLAAGLSALSGGVPVLGLIATLILWRIKAKESPFLDDHGCEAVNFQISLLLYYIVGGIVGGILTAITLGLFSIVMVLGAVALFIVGIVACIRGAIASNRGEFYRYPICVRFLRGSLAA